MTAEHITDHELLHRAAIFKSEYKRAFDLPSHAPVGKNKEDLDALRVRMGLVPYKPRAMPLGEALEVSRGLR
jgi:hypothetical protein